MAISMNESLVSLRDVPNHLPADPDGNQIDESSVYRWARIGVNGRKLETLRFGRKLFTSIEALERFGTPDPTEDELQAEAIEKANSQLLADEAELEAMGA
jgi:Protein of unknown function (DUF1580)